MPTSPSASTTIDDQAGTPAAGLDLLTVIAPVSKNADSVPRVFANHAALLDQYDFAPGVSYCASHFQETGKPVLFVGVPIVTAGVVGRQNTTGNTGSSVVSIAVGGVGALEECDIVVTAVTGGIIGTDQIMLGLSLDGGLTTKRIRLGTANSYVIPRVGLTLSLAAGTLIAGDTVLTAHSTAPRWDSTGLTGARTALAAQQKASRSWLVVGDLTAKADADAITTETNAYETANERFTLARAQIRDRLASAKMARTIVRMTGNPNLTFAEVGGTGDTITRSAGSWITDGFAVGDIITVTGSATNNFVGTSKITGVTATVLTFGVDDLAAETIGAVLVTITAGETKAQHVSKMDALFAAVDAQKRIDLGLGRGRKACPVLGYTLRRPVQWAASIREYQHDVQIPTWRKSDGPLDGWDLNDASGNLVEYDERVDGGALAARFTCFRTWANGPLGAFIDMSLTRDTEGSLFSRTHNMAVANVACSVNQRATENAVGEVLDLKDDGTATAGSLAIIAGRTNSALDLALLSTGPEGKRASNVEWKPDADDVLNTVGATLNGTLELLLEGTLEHIKTKVKAKTAG